MTKHMQLLAGVVILLLGAKVQARAETGKTPTPPTTFAVADIHLEQNATDADYEVVVEALGRADGLTKFTVVAPDGRTIIDFTGTQPSELGMRQFRFESPEPKNFNSLKAAYPEGAYTFSGTTASGAKLQSTATLSHKLPTAAATLLEPKPGAKNVSPKNLQISWTPVKNATAYMVYIEQDKLDVSLNVKLLGSADSFTVPEEFLFPNTEYTLGVGAVMSNGNSSFVETSFMTGAKQ